jgi:uncharacterized Tic20 family protein
MQLLKLFRKAVSHSVAFLCVGTVSLLPTWTQAGLNVTLNNPLQVPSLEALIVAILNIFVTLMIPIIVFFIILAGFRYVTAQGNAGKIEEATTTLMYAIIGGVLVLAAVAIAEIIRNTVDAFRATS